MARRKKVVKAWYTMSEGIRWAFGKWVKEILPISAVFGLIMVYSMSESSGGFSFLGYNIKTVLTDVGAETTTVTKMEPLAFFDFVKQFANADMEIYKAYATIVFILAFCYFGSVFLCVISRRKRHKEYATIAKS